MLDLTENSGIADVATGELRQDGKQPENMRFHYLS